MVVGQIGLQAVKRQALLVPWPGSGVAQLDPAKPCGTAWCHAGLAAELGLRRLWPQRDQIQALPLGLSPDDGLGLPGGNLG